MELFYATSPNPILMPLCPVCLSVSMLNLTAMARRYAKPSVSLIFNSPFSITRASLIFNFQFQNMLYICPIKNCLETV
jgi:hypothetical protein